MPLPASLTHLHWLSHHVHSINTPSSQLDGVHVSAAPASTRSSQHNAVSPPAADAGELDPHNTNWDQIDIKRFLVLLLTGSTVETALFYPLFVLKTREQSDRRKLSVWQSFKQVTHSAMTQPQGIRNLYRGFWFTCGVNLPAYGVYMAAYTKSKDMLGYDPHNANDTLTAKCAPLLAGAIADAVSLPFYVPGDVIAQRLQLDNSPYKNARDAMRTIYAREGIKGLYVGFNATLITSCFASAVWWQSYEYSKRFLYQPEVSQYLHSPFSSGDTKADSVGGSVNRIPQLLAGFLAGEITAVVANPLDVVKTRIQTQDATLIYNDEMSTAQSHHRYKTTFGGLKSLWQTEGLAGYFRGVLPKLLNRGPLSAASSLMYELILYYSRKDVDLRAELHKLKPA